MGLKVRRFKFDNEREAPFMTSTRFLSQLSDALSKESQTQENSTLEQGNGTDSKTP